MINCISHVRLYFTYFRKVFTIYFLRIFLKIVKENFHKTNDIICNSNVIYESSDLEVIKSPKGGEVRGVDIMVLNFPWKGGESGFKYLLKLGKSL